MLTGEFEIVSDDKGRIFIPNKFKEELAGETLYLTKGLEQHCLQILRAESYQKIEDIFFSSDAFLLDENVNALKRRLVGSTTEFKIADRLLIPLSLRAFAGIKPKSEIVLLGMIDRIEIWEKEAYYRYSEEQDDNIKIAAGALKQMLENK